MSHKKSENVFQSVHLLTSSLLTDSAETSKIKVTVETPHSSVKMRAASQLPAVGPDDDLTGMLLQVGYTMFFVSFISDVTLSALYLVFE